MENPYAPPRTPLEPNVPPVRVRDRVQILRARVCWIVPLIVLAVLLLTGEWGSLTFLITFRVVCAVWLMLTLIQSILMWRARHLYVEVAGHALCGIVGNGLLLLLTLSGIFGMLAQEWH
jgi:hypothetical protein